MTIATFAAGCFWGVEAVFRKIDGVNDVMVGYIGGTTQNPSYEQVCSHTTGHAEAVQIEFDDKKVSYEQLLEVFWRCHNPTQVNQQGFDRGTQYRSAIFFHTPEQQKIAEGSKLKLTQSGTYADPIATEITPAAIFYKAGEYHQRYYEKHPTLYCNK
jgi:peptide-methionine (S)-S-oxide reductase